MQNHDDSQFIGNEWSSRGIPPNVPGVWLGDLQNLWSIGSTDLVKEDCQFRGDHARQTSLIA